MCTFWKSHRSYVETLCTATLPKGTLHGVLCFTGYGIPKQTVWKNHTNTDTAIRLGILATVVSIKSIFIPAGSFDATVTSVLLKLYPHQSQTTKSEHTRWNASLCCVMTWMGALGRIFWGRVSSGTQSRCVDTLCAKTKEKENENVSNNWLKCAETMCLRSRSAAALSTILFFFTVFNVRFSMD